MLGLALERPGDLVEAEIRDEPGVEITQVTGADSLGTDPNENVVGIAAQAALEHLGVADRGVRLALHKQMPLGSGLGSSAASSVAGAAAVGALFGDTLPKEALVGCALRGEAAASGAPHADNVAPCVLGGIVLIRGNDPLDLIRLPVPDALRIVLVHPHVEVLTAEARRLVARHRFGIGQAVANLGNIAALVHALHTGDLELFGRSISDALVEPIRAPLVPGFAEVRQAALDAGALGCSISGSGPSLFAFAGSSSAAGNGGRRHAGGVRRIRGGQRSLRRAGQPPRRGSAAGTPLAPGFRAGPCTNHSVFRLGGRPHGRGAAVHCGGPAG